jgi:hypothetical protein
MLSGMKHRNVLTAAGSSVGIFILDLLSPPDLAICVFYLAVLVMVPFRLLDLSVLTGIGVAFTMLAGFAGTVQGDADLVWLNRVLIAGALVCAAMLALWAHRKAQPGEAAWAAPAIGEAAQSAAPPRAAVRAAAATPPGTAHGGVRIATINLRLLNTLADQGPCTPGALHDALLASGLPGLDSANVAALVEQALTRLAEGGLAVSTADGAWALTSPGAMTARRPVDPATA